MITIRGDLLNFALDGRFDVIVHGCNCQCTMGAGIAKQIKALFPEAYEADLRTVKGAREKLGTISFATITRGATSFAIVNGYTQFAWRGRGVKVDYDAVRSVMRHVRTEFSGQRIGYPQIGAGLAGGDWSTIADIIESELSGEDHSLVRYEPA
ncbi:macro domain-containing protein [Solimonas marina]|uniref:Phosphatase n=1 Tax=Solimonas marina TaxID=2714601 RepID=A0A969W774_9GAMM|nr:macro domain-containing protein [Solimonas marina]NKF21208.1 phosphatase [Solimonas marina]